MKKTIIKNILIVALILAVGYMFASEISQLSILRKENERIRIKIDQLEVANKELRKKIEAIKNDERYIEKLAREELGMIKEGEKVYRFAE
ncbi:MAG TPA: septum formation initiator family protein [Thermodesulfobacteriota bacterium]|nr:septum formation initiator family protein [Thermodesulfobacteriota bacterium]